VADIAADYRSKQMAAVVFTVDAEAATGQPALSNEEIAQAAAEHPDVLVPFGSIDPHRGVAGVRAARRLVTEHGVRGFKFHPSLMDFLPNDRAHYPLYAELESLGVPALFHTGQTGIGSGLPGGRGIKLRYSDPMLLDDVAADFPGLTMIMAHPSVPWQDAAIASTSTSPAGPRSTSRRSWSARPTRCSGRRCCSARTTRSSAPSGGSATSKRSRSATRSSR
jgi:predicted TIM-barrel fold metal-dependent hydrolase